LKTSAVAGAAALVAPAVHAGGSDILKLGIVGVGGRGSGAVRDAMAADPNVKLVTACDIFEDRLNEGIGNLKLSKGIGERIDIPSNRMHTGFDGYKGVIDSDVDVVILATSPGFRPIHFAYAVEKNKHVFMEKPHATDAPGVRSVIESAKKAKEKGLSVVSGFCYRYDHWKRDVVAKIHDGEIGKVLAVHTTYNTGALWDRSGKAKTHDPREMEYQLRMWYYFNWLSGDFLVEQAIHNVDKTCWVMGDEYPTHATASGGRQVRTDPKYGNIFDHFAVVYEYASGAKVFLECRQQPGCANGTIDHVIGSAGSCQLMQHSIKNEKGEWRHPRAAEWDLGPAYVHEHEELYAAIRGGKPINDAERSAKSTLMGLLGRQAAYTGQRIKWADMMNSKDRLLPETFAWGQNEVKTVAMPGKTKFV
jgi:myo-inositol 2-dehydrogenase / D-chiro-inositol 1-dehydrogenase